MSDITNGEGGGSSANLEAANVKVGVGEKISYSCGCGGIIIMMYINMSYMNFYWTDVLMMPLGLVASFLFVCKIWDAVNDPIIGWMSDRSSQKHGYRRWIINFIPMLVFGFFMFSKPPGSGTNVGYIFTFIMYFGYVWFNTATEVPHVSLMSTMTTNYNQRGVLASFRQSTANIMMVILSAAFLPIAMKLGDNDMGAGFPPTMLIFFGISVPLYLICYFGTKERVKPAVAERYPITESFKALKGNLPLFMLMLCYFVWGFQGGISSSGRMYYFTYIAENMDHFAPNMTFMSTGGLIATILLGVFAMKSKNKRNIGIVTWVGGGILYIAMWFVDSSTAAGMRVFDILTFVQMLFAGMGMASIYALVPDVTEYTQGKHGIRASGFLFALINFASKVGAAISQAVFTASLATTGYVPGGGSQNDAVLSLIRGSITIWPGILLFVGVFAFFMIKINRQTHEATLNKLSE
jgi:sugar (glycoside-pentoside-hexuronide) transporter